MNENNAIKYIRSAEALPLRNTPEHSKKLLAALGESFKIIKIYGETGKSLLALRLSHLLSAAGFRTGTLSLSHPEKASRDAILVNGAAISGALFAETVSKASSAFESDATAEELLLASGLLALKKENCRFILLEIPALPYSATKALGSPLLNLVAQTDNVETAKIICNLLDKDSEETVTCVQPAPVMKLLTDRCAQVNCRITFPILQNSLYPMEHTLGKIRFFYNKKEYLLHSGAKYDLYATLSLIECYHALIRRGVRLTLPALSAALAAAPSKHHFHVFSMSPPILLDTANTPLRLRALRDTLDFQSDIVGTTFDLWTSEETLATITSAWEKKFCLRTVSCMDEKNIYRSVKLALREYDRRVPLLILGSSELICQIERNLKNLI